METTTTVTGSNEVKIGYPLKFVTTYYRQRDLTSGIFFRNICVLKMSIFINVYIDLHFQGHLLQLLDEQRRCYPFYLKFDENRLNGVVDIQRFSVFFR